MTVVEVNQRWTRLGSIQAGSRITAARTTQLAISIPPCHHDREVSLLSENEIEWQQQCQSGTPCAWQVLMSCSLLVSGMRPKARPVTLAKQMCHGCHGPCLKSSTRYLQVRFRLVQNRCGRSSQRIPDCGLHAGSRRS